MGASVSPLIVIPADEAVGGGGEGSLKGEDNSQDASLESRKIGECSD
jgi:hypothetical protein